MASVGTNMQRVKMSDSVTLNIDGKNIVAQSGERLIDVAQREGAYIPRFCYHPKLSVVASCRMCLVDIEGVGKTQPACATIVQDGMVVRTNSEKAIKAQKIIMQFLLINHPLSCPICDQGGECELQDTAMGYGPGVSQFQPPFSRNPCFFAICIIFQAAPLRILLETNHIPKTFDSVFRNRPT